MYQHTIAWYQGEILEAWFIVGAGVLRYHQMNFGYLPRPEPKDSFVSGSVALTTLNLPMPKSDESGLSLPNDPLEQFRFNPLHTQPI